MSKTPEWPRIAVVGAGAVGGYFGGMFARAGAPTVFIGRKHFADSVTAGGLVLDKSDDQERIKIDATVDMSAIRDCSLILFCVKASDTSATARQMAALVRPDATVVCLQNGVDNADQVRAAANVVVVPAAVYVAVSVPEPGRVKHLARGVLPGVHDQASGIAAAMEIATQMHGAFSSTAQDLSRGRPTEIEALNGYVARRGMELGVSVPVNHALFTLVKLAEQRKDT